jgi:hypothetical protein
MSQREERDTSFYDSFEGLPSFPRHHHLLQNTHDDFEITEDAPNLAEAQYKRHQY